MLKRFGNICGHLIFGKVLKYSEIRRKSLGRRDVSGISLSHDHGKVKNFNSFDSKLAGTILGRLLDRKKDQDRLCLNHLGKNLQLLL